MNQNHQCCQLHHTPRGYRRPFVTGTTRRRTKERLYRSATGRPKSPGTSPRRQAAHRHRPETRRSARESFPGQQLGALGERRDHWYAGPLGFRDQLRIPLITLPPQPDRAQPRADSTLDVGLQLVPHEHRLLRRDADELAEVEEALRLRLGPAQGVTGVDRSDPAREARPRQLALGVDLAGVGEHAHLPTVLEASPKERRHVVEGGDPIGERRPVCRLEGFGVAVPRGDAEALQGGGHPATPHGPEVDLTAGEGGEPALGVGTEQAPTLQSCPVRELRTYRRQRHRRTGLHGGPGRDEGVVEVEQHGPHRTPGPRPQPGLTAYGTVTDQRAQARSSRSRRSRAIVECLPRISIDSKSGGLIRAPETAVRGGPNASFALIPNPSMRAERSAASMAGAFQPDSLPRTPVPVSSRAPSDSSAASSTRGASSPSPARASSAISSAWSATKNGATSGVASARVTMRVWISSATLRRRASSPSEGLSPSTPSLVRNGSSRWAKSPISRSRM